MLRYPWDLTMTPPDIFRDKEVLGLSEYGSSKLDLQQMISQPVVVPGFAFMNLVFVMQVITTKLVCCYGIDINVVMYQPSEGSSASYLLSTVPVIIREAEYYVVRGFCSQ